MKNKLILILFLVFLSTWSPVQGLGPSKKPSAALSMEPQEILINNRILTTVNGKPVSLMDVVKQLDILFHRQFPEYEHSLVARFQFYTANWKVVAQDMLNKELVLADAEELKFPVTHGEIREEMENSFGPNVMATLRRIGIGYDEAFNLMRDEITIKRMMTFRVNSKAMFSVGPQDVKTAYQEFVQKKPPKTEWDYQFLTVRGEDTRAVSAVARQAHAFLNTGRFTLEQVEEKLRSGSLPTHVTVSLSSPLSQNSQSVSETIYDTLSCLEVGQYSEPIAGIGRKDGKPFERILWLKSSKTEKVPSFNEKEKEIENQLYQIAVDRQGKQYMAFLQEHFSTNLNLDQLLPNDFQPFALR